MLFGRTSGHWLFYISSVYLIAGLWSVYKGVDLVWLSPFYILFLAMPFWLPPLGRAMNIDVTWDIKMFDWFKSKKDEETKSNVVPFPDPKSVPYVEPPKVEEPAKIFYRIGVTDQHRVAFSMGYSEITMNKQGVQQLIDQLTVFMNQIEQEETQ